MPPLPEGHVRRQPIDRVVLGVASSAALDGVVQDAGWLFALAASGFVIFIVWIVASRQSPRDASTGHRRRRRRGGRADRDGHDDVPLVVRRRYAVVEVEQAVVAGVTEHGDDSQLTVEQTAPREGVGELVPTQSVDPTLAPSHDP